jgi:predicted metal-dependent enzyme (double-stranded beta helix superfamily)
VGFAVDDLVAAIVDAQADGDAILATREVLTQAVGSSREMADALSPRAGGLQVLYNTADLTILNVVWAPGMYLVPHNHLMWAEIAVYAGTEDNEFFRRAPDDSVHLVETGGKNLETGEVLLLGDDAIHSVRNSLDRVTAAIHVYGGDFVRKPRSQWGPGPREERAYDLEFVNQEFAAANARAGLT